MLLMRNVSGFLCTGVLLAVSGCGDSNSAPTADAGGDTTNDATVDGSAGGSDSGGALHDSGVVPGVDASDDATTDDPPTDDDDASATDDTSTDDGSDPAQDASVPVADGGTDVGNDSGSSEDSGAEDGDAQAPPPDQGWSGCPSAESVVQDPSSPLTLEVTQDAIYCATYNETRTLKGGTVRFAMSAAYRSPPVAPYRQVLPMMTVSFATNPESRCGLSTSLPAAMPLPT